jgi:hypothetical protein
MSIIQAKEPEFTTVLKQFIPIENTELRQFDTKFSHYTEAISSLDSGQKGFETSETYHSTEGWNFSK